MRLASYNVENLFARAAALNGETWSNGKAVLEEYAKLNALLQSPDYTASIKSKILAGIDKLGLTKADANEFVILRQNRGRLLKRSKTGGIEVVAGGREDWVGWLDLKTEAVNETAITMTARVIRDLNADILAVVEAENRISLKQFNDQILVKLTSGYEEIMVIDGNDARGIDVGLMARNGFRIESMSSHVNDMDGKNNPIFSRDCAEYLITSDDAPDILVLVNHYKSKGYGDAKSSDAKRKKQAQRTREIYEERKNQGIEHIAIVGDFNDTPDSDPMSPLFSRDSDLKDISSHANFQDDGRPGTYANGTKSNKIDYILLSPSLFKAVESAGVFRMGVWGGKNGTLFPHYPEMTKAEEAASDHAALWVEIKF